MATDKNLEKDRYDQRAAMALKTGGGLPPLGVSGVPLELRQPYAWFEDILQATAQPKDHVLDLCCGDGQFSFVSAETGAQVTGLDLSAASLELAARRCPERMLDKISWVEGDCEKLPFDDGSFTGVTCLGGLSYGDWILVLDEVIRVLRPGGWFIAVDSYNHNPIYRFNRWMHRLRGDRTASVNRRIPSRRWLTLGRERFASLEVEYYGAYSFLAPVLRPLVGVERTARWLNYWDTCSCTSREWAFKIAVKAYK